MEEVKEKKPGFFKRLEKSKKGQVLFFVVSMCVLVILFFTINGKFVIIGEKRAVLQRNTESEYMIITSIDEFTCTDSEFIFSGLAFHREKENRQVYLVLDAVGDMDKVAFKTNRHVKSELGEVFNVGSNEPISYEVTILKDDISDSMCYEILLDVAYVDEENGREKVKYRQISTNYFLSNGDIYIGIEKPSVTVDTFKNIVQEGMLCFYMKKEKVWVYLYNEKIYWFIADTGIMDLDALPNLRVYMYPYDIDEIMCGEEKIDREEGYIYREMEVSEENYYEQDLMYVLWCDFPKNYDIAYIRNGVFLNGHEKKWAFRNVFPLNNYKNE